MACENSKAANNCKKKKPSAATGTIYTKKISFSVVPTHRNEITGILIISMCPLYKVHKTNA